MGMKMKQITLCNYYGMCDGSQNVMGHTCKVTREYADLLSSKYKVSLIASPCIVAAMENSNIEIKHQLKYNIYVDVPFTLKKRITDKVKLLTNLRDCFRTEGSDALFFYQVDFFFFFYVALFLHRNHQKVYCLIYHQDFTGGKIEKILKWFYRRALKKIDGILYTQIGHAVVHRNTCWMPDYLYDEKNYQQYEKMEKRDKVVCLGTMNRYKQLEELITVFSINGYPLEVAGKFEDVERYERLKKCAASNIVIENRTLHQDEYYERLGSAKYSILPYDMSQYLNRTSGVLLESLFVGSTPLAPVELLEQNCLPGIGYREIQELEKPGWQNRNLDLIKGERQRIITECSKEKVVRAFESIICNS